MKTTFLNVGLFESMALWSYFSVAAIVILLVLIVRFLSKSSKSNKNFALLIPVAAVLLLLNSCSRDNKSEDPNPSAAPKSQNDFDGGTLGEVTVVGHIETQWVYYDDGSSIGNPPPSSSGGGGGGGNGTTGGGSGSPLNPEQDQGDGDPNAPLQPLGHIAVITNQLNATQSLRIAIDVRNNQVFNVTSYASGLTAGTSYTQNTWAPISASNGVYTVQMIWYVSYSLFLDGFGTVGNSNPIRSTVTWDSNTNTTTIVHHVIP